ncbi:MAG: ABC transporter permease [Egibacteraceae bacterium]
MRVYWEIARRGYQRYAAYPAATWAGVFTNTVFGFMRGSVLLALYAHRGEIGGYDASAALTYTWLVQALLMAVYIWGWRELGDRIRTGDIAIDLARPVNLQLAGLSSDFGRALYHLVFRGIPPLLVGAVVFELRMPSGPAAAIAFLVSLVLAVAVSYGFRFLYSLPAFWIVDIRGVMVLAMVASILFSGMTVPVAFFPAWLATVAYATPFPAMAQIPVDIFMGVLSGPEVGVALIIQAAWVAALLLAGHVIFAAGTRRLVVQGG